MVRKLIEWAVTNPLIVLLLTAGLAGFGAYAFMHVNVEAYPDPAPAIVEVVAQYPGASAEEIERQVTIPLEVALASLPNLSYTRSKSLYGLSHLRNQFEYGVDYYKAKQEIINRLQNLSLPAGVTPQISPFTPTGELMRYTLSSPKDALGRDIYTLNDLKALNDWTLVRQLRRVPRIADVSSFGGTVKRYEIHPDPDQLKRYGISLSALQNAIANSNANVGADPLPSGGTTVNVRGIGLLGGGLDPAQRVLGFEQQELDALADSPMPDHQKRKLAGRKAANRAVEYLRQEDDRRIKEIREIVIASVNNVPVRVEDVVEGGPLASSGEEVGKRGVVVGYQTRLGRVSASIPRRDVHGHILKDANGQTVWDDENEKVMGIVLMRKYEDSLPAVTGVKAKLEEMNAKPGRLLPGVRIDELHFDLSSLIDVTTETVRENLLLGMVLVTVVLLMFLSNVRSALIVAVNIPLALLFAFLMLFVRGKSANLLSIGAVDFGIIVDSSVIMVENIYRHISAGENAELPLKVRIIRASGEVERALFYSTAIMVCAFIPLFTMQGPEGQIFGPMADTYVFALGGALMLALTLAPVLCLIFFRNLQPSRDNFLVRWLKHRYLWQLDVCLRHRFVTLAVLGALIVGTVAMLPFLGREFMPELEEGNLYIRGTFPVNVSLDEASDKVRRARAIIHKYPEVVDVLTQTGRPDDGTDPSGYNNTEFTVPLKPLKDWPKVKAQEGWLGWLWPARRRTKPELVEEVNTELRRDLIGVDWNFSQYIRDNVMESLSGVKGDNSVKIFGPDLDELEKLANEVKTRLEAIPGMADVGIFRIKGQGNLEFGIDRAKAKFWGVSVNDVQTALKTAVGGQAFTQMTEGEKTFDITIRWPAGLRGDEEAILNVPVDITNNTVTPGTVSSLPQTPLTGSSSSVSITGTSQPGPAITGSQMGGTVNPISNAPRLRMRDLVTPVDEYGRPNPGGDFKRAGASIITREQGQRFIAIKFSVRGRDLASAVADAKQRTAGLVQAPYSMEWSGEFQEMEQAEARLMVLVPLSLGLIFVLLYLAFHSLLDVFAILSNVVALSLGGVWALILTGTNFSISAAVGFISIFGVAIMDGLLSVSYFNRLRSVGRPLHEAIMEGAAKRVRPMMMTALTAVLGLLPAALSTRIGSQTQQPLAIVVVGAMLMTLLLNRYLMPVLYSFYGHREPSASARGLAH
jgi:cobalt-zinc-cadmium resistance protein CzcA